MRQRDGQRDMDIVIDIVMERPSQREGSYLTPFQGSAVCFQSSRSLFFLLTFRVLNLVLFFNRLAVGRFIERG